MFRFGFFFFKDHGVYLAAFMEYLSDENGIPVVAIIDSELMCNHYAVLLWDYRMRKIPSVTMRHHRSQVRWLLAVTVRIEI